MARKNTLKEDDNPQELNQGKMVLGTKIQKKIRMIGPGGEEVEYVIRESWSESEKDGIYAESETLPVHFDVGGTPLNLESGFIRVSNTGALITSPEQWAVCTSLFHRKPNKNIYVGVDGTSHGDGQGICVDCQKVLNMIQLLVAILGLGAVIGLFRAYTILF